MSETHEYLTRTTPVADLTDEMTIVGESGGLSSIYEAPKVWSVLDYVQLLVRTEHGLLIFAHDATVEILDF